MVTIEGNRRIWDNPMVFFPSSEELQQLTDTLTVNRVLRIIQTSANLQKHSNLIHQRVFRTSCIDLTQDIEVIYQQMNSTTRQNIRKSEKMDENIQIQANNLLAHESFLELYDSFVHLKRHIHPLSKRRFQEYLKVSDVFVIYHDSRAICGHVFIRDESVKRVRLLLSASCRLQGEEDSRLSGLLNRYLHWHEIQYYKTQGIRLYDFGGIGDGSRPVAKFKLSFGGVPIQEMNYTFAKALSKWGYKAYERASHLRTLLRI